MAEDCGEMAEDLCGDKSLVFLSTEPPALEALVYLRQALAQSPAVVALCLALGFDATGLIPNHCTLHAEAC